MLNTQANQGDIMNATLEAKINSRFAKHLVFINWVCASQAVIAVCNFIFPA